MKFKEIVILAHIHNSKMNVYTDNFTSREEQKMCSFRGNHGKDKYFYTAELIHIT